MKIYTHECNLQKELIELLEQGHIEKALSLIKDPTRYWDMWYDDDIKMVADDMGYPRLSDKEVQEVMHNMKLNFDAEQGINWYVIRATIENIKGDK